MTTATATPLDVQRLTAQCLTRFRPDPDLTITEWADTYRQLSSKNAAEPGPYRSARTPYLREIMRCLSPSDPTEEVVLMKGAQIGGSEAGNNWIGYVMAQAPGPMMLVQPTVETAKRYSKQRISTMIEDTPPLRTRVKDARERDSGNTMLAKEFEGGILIITGANSGVGLRSMPVRYLFLDEIDAYPWDVDTEGDPVSLAIKRTTTFSNRKIFRCSTPLEKWTSRIEPAYEETDQGHYYVHCPWCKHLQWLRWAQLVFSFEGVHDADRAMYRCEACERLIPEHHKTSMLDQGEWRSEKPERRTGHRRGFHLSALYSPLGWRSWASLAEEFLTATHKRDQMKLKTFVNTGLAETWEEAGEQIDTAILATHRETYEAEVPAPVLVLTASIDVQGDRLEAECVGWGEGEESWSLDYRQFFGSPAQAYVWEQLDAWLLRTWTHASGVAMRIAQTCVDSGGHHTKEVYAFVRKRQGRRVYAIKGSNQPGAKAVTLGGKDALTRVRLFLVGTDALKDTLFARFQLDTPGPGYCHFPETEAYTEEYFAQLTAEEKRNKYEKGVLVGTYYQKIRARNEALDLRIYNMAALAVLNPHWPALAAHAARATERRPAEEPAAPRPDEPGAAITEAAETPPPSPQPAPRARGFATRYGWGGR